MRFLARSLRLSIFLLALVCFKGSYAQEPPIIFVTNFPYDTSVPETNIGLLQNAGLHINMSIGDTRVVEFTNGIRARYQKITNMGSFQIRQVGERWSVGQPDPADPQAGNWRERAIVIGVMRWPTNDSMVAAWLAQLDFIIGSGGAFMYWSNPVYINPVYYWVWPYSDW